MMEDLDSRPIRIPAEPCHWRPEIYMGKEVEFTPVGCRNVNRSELAGAFVRRLAQVLPSSPHSPDTSCDLFTPLGRIYREMRDFVEVAGPTCRSGEAVAWASEAAMEALSRVTVEAHGQTAVLCHIPSDYNDRLSNGEGPAHSTGCHFNMLSPRPLSIDQTRAFAALTSPLNAVFGPGGWAWSPQARLAIVVIRVPTTSIVSLAAQPTAKGASPSFSSGTSPTPAHRSNDFNASPLGHPDLLSVPGCRRNCCRWRFVRCWRENLPPGA